MISPIAVRLEIIDGPVVFDDVVQQLHAAAVARGLPVVCQFTTLNSDSPWTQDVVVHPRRDGPAAQARMGTQ